MSIPSWYKLVSYLYSQTFNVLNKQKNFIPIYILNSIVKFKEIERDNIEELAPSQSKKSLVIAPQNCFS